ncbi:MAG: PLP-dependent lyase/thiolase [Candidatus Dojkabacteria bacterium]|nr:MAG: PLP-dependent lyase/thiolase [Candidatus Dojkabacteria bacterium]
MSIWKYAEQYNPIVDIAARIENNAGNTELTQIEIDGHAVWLKREDQNPTGSHKDRSLAFQLSAHIADGRQDFVISSSGNSVISAANIVKQLPNIKLNIFLSPKLSESKKARLEKYLGSEIDISSKEPQLIGNITLHFSRRALSDSFRFAKEHEYVLLRGSQDPYAVEGFKSLGYELLEQLPDITDIFMATSSGTTLVGVAKSMTNVRVHACQSSSINLIASHFDRNFVPSESSIADSIVDRVGHRKDEAIRVINESEGSGWVISDEEINNSLEMLKINGVNSSAEGALALAAYRKAINSGWEISKPVCIISGIA